MEHHHEKTSHVKAHVHRHESMQDGHPHEHHARATAEGMDQGGHDKHAGHSPEMFRNRFVVSLVLTLPILYYEHLFQQWFGYRAVQFPGSAWIPPVLAIVIFFYGGLPFVQSAPRAAAARQPRLISPVALALNGALTFNHAGGPRPPAMPSH